jgi:hypothetical protein
MDATKDELGFDTPAAKLAAGLSAQICIEIGDTLQYIEDELSKCKTLKQFTAARTRIRDRTVEETLKVVELTMNMTRESAKVRSAAKKRKIEEE